MRHQNTVVNKNRCKWFKQNYYSHWFCFTSLRVVAGHENRQRDFIHSSSNYFKNLIIIYFDKNICANVDKLTCIEVSLRDVITLFFILSSTFCTILNFLCGKICLIYLIFTVSDKIHPQNHPPRINRLWCRCSHSISSFYWSDAPRCLLLITVVSTKDEATIGVLFNISIFNPALNSLQP